MGRFNFNNEKFEKIRNEAEEFYGAVEFVPCPYWNEKIVFNAKGLRHLKFKSDRQARSRSDQYVRFKLLYLAPEILKRSRTLQGVWKIKRFEKMNTNSRWEEILKEVIFYEFIAVIDDIRAKVIVKEVQGGEKYFWSIIPYWGIDKKNRQRILYGGNPEND